MALLDVAGAVSLSAAVPTESASNYKEENRVFSHVMIGTNDIARSKSFYDALIGAIGGTPGVQEPSVHPSTPVQAAPSLHASALLHGAHASVASRQLPSQGAWPGRHVAPSPGDARPFRWRSLLG